MNFTDYFHNIPTFMLKSCNLREIGIQDASNLFHYYNNKNVYQYLDWNGPSSEEEAKEIITHWNQGFKDGWIIRFGIVDKQKNNLIGTIFLNGFEGRRCEIGYELSETYWNKGIMSEAMKAMIDLSFNTFDKTRIQATVCFENVASEALLKKHGFIFEGVLRQYEEHNITKQIKDMRLFSLIRDF